MALQRLMAATNGFYREGNRLAGWGARQRVGPRGLRGRMSGFGL